MNICDVPILHRVVCAIKVSMLKNNKDLKSGYNNLEDSIRKSYVELNGKIGALEARIGALEDAVDTKIDAYILTNLEMNYLVPMHKI